MNEIDFIEALSDGKSKTAGVLDSLKARAPAALAAIKAKTPEILAALGGAGLVGGGQYLMNRGKDGKPSVQQRAGQASVEGAEALKSRAKKEKRPLTFSEDLSTTSASAAKGYADTLARHPGKGALLVAPVGALAGLKILKALR